MSVVSAVNPSDEVICYDSSKEFYDLLAQIPEGACFDEKWSRLEQLATDVSQTAEKVKQCFMLYLPFQEEGAKNGVEEEEKYLELYFQRVPYQSKAFDPSFFAQDRGLCHYIRAVESPLSDQVAPNLLQIRLSKDNAELMWLQKGKKFKGGELIELFKRLMQPFKLPLYLYDDSKLYADFSQDALCLKSITALSQGKTLYESKLGFSLLDGKDMPLLLQDGKKEKPLKLSQDSIAYKKALKNLRELSLEHLEAIYAPLYKKHWKKVKKVIQAVFKNDLANHNLAELVEALAGAYRKQPNKANFQNLSLVFNYLLKPWKLHQGKKASLDSRKDPMQKIEEYLQALHTLSGARIFHRPPKVLF